MPAGACNLLPAQRPPRADASSQPCQARQGAAKAQGGHQPHHGEHVFTQAACIISGLRCLSAQPVYICMYVCVYTYKLCVFVF